jgi:hypothetical protein
MSKNPRRDDGITAGAGDSNEQNNLTALPPSFQQTNSANARTYIRRGWRPVPIALYTKKPIILNWPSFRVTEAEAPQHFGRPCNIGVILGDGLVDVDLDCVEAIDLAPKMLPATSAIFGRPSKPKSHWLYQVEGEVRTIKFVDPVSGEMLLEIRGDGSQTVFPRSVHQSGEIVEWANDGEPAATNMKELIRAGARIAAHVLGKRYCKNVIVGDDESLRQALDGVTDPRVTDRIILWLDSLPAPNNPKNNDRVDFPVSPLPDHLAKYKQRGISDRLSNSLAAVWSPSEQARLESALQTIPSDAYETWVTVGMALEALHWETNEGDIGFEMWDRWSQGTPAKYSPGICEEKWKTFDRPGHRQGVTIGTIYHLAQQNGWNSAVLVSKQSGKPMDGQQSAPIFAAGSPAALKAVSADAPVQKPKELGQREKLIRIGLNADLWHDKDGVAFATINVLGHYETFALRTSAFRNQLLREYGARYSLTIDGEICPSAPSDQAIKEAINVLAAKAAGGAEHPAAIRVAEEGNSIYIDLGTPDWSVVEISADIWRIVQASPVRFIRPPGLLPLPVPIKGGDIRELRRFLNARDDDFVLVVAWLLAALRPTGPYPVLIVNGEQGAGKTMSCRALRRLVDPNSAELRSDPRNERDLFLAAKNGRVVALDNLSYVRNDLSDAICRITTTGAFATRALYTDGEEFFVQISRPVLLNGIPALASRPDLADRATVTNLPAIPESNRRSEREFWSEFEGAAPRLLGALLDGVSGAMRNIASIKFQKPPRMIDFAQWAEAGWRSFGLQPGVFEEIYARNREQASSDALDADPLAASILAMMSNKTELVETATELLSALGPPTPSVERDRRWPKDATRLSNSLRRLAPLLRQRGIEIDFDQRSNDATRKRFISIKKGG